MPPTPLPEPTRSRWQPLRAGLVDIFYYDAEEFHFHDGRLLLRGNNGTGKSKVLALTLPFLLDGELAAHRVEPDGDRAKRMEWNLLLGGRHPHDERTGYTWLEFGRTTEDGRPQYRTIGCGLKAVKGRGIAKHWFFTTSLRVGPDLPLLSATRVPYTRERLRDALEGHGLVHDTASEYRRAVDEQLFGLGRERYEALVNLLIQLRQPQLSKKPDERLLSKALTESLPPLDPSLIGEVAEAFRGLDEERHALEALAEASGAAAGFLAHYRRYARIAAKRQAGVLRLAHSRYEHLGRDLGEAENEHAAAEERLARAEVRLEELESARRTLSATREALNRSPEMDAARGLEQAGRTAEALRAIADDRAVAVRTARRLADDWQRRASTAHAQTEADRTGFAEADQAARQAAGTAGLDHAPVAATLERDQPPFQETRRVGERAAGLRRQAVSGLGALLGAAEQAQVRARSAQAEAARRASDLEAALERSAEAGQAVAARGGELVAAWRAWAAATVELRLSDPDQALAALEAWTDTLAGPNPATEAVAAGYRAAAEALTRRETGLDAEAAAARSELTAVKEEIDRLESGGHDAPPPPHTRDPHARAKRAGVPLWRAVDFHDAVPASDRAGIEAALEAAGLLDAWLTPDGTLLDATTYDAVLLPGAAAPGPGLAAALRPAVDRANPRAAALGDEAVRTVLAAIGLGESPHHTWVATDGRYRIGALTGRWGKPAAHFIGEGAREAARRARLAALAAQRDELLSVLGQLNRELDAVRERAAALTAEQRAEPSDGALREAHARLSHEAETTRRLGDRRAEAERDAADRRQDFEKAQQEAQEYASDTGLPTRPDQLDQIRDAISGYATALAALLPAAAARARSAALAAEADAEAQTAASALAEAEDAAGEARRTADAQAEHHRVLVETVGASVEELFRRLAETDAAMAERDAAEKSTRRARDAAMTARGEAEGRRHEIRVRIAEAVAERDRAVTALRSFAATGLLTAALPGLTVPPPDEPWAPTPAVALARTVNQELDDTDDSDRRWELIQQRISAEHKVLTDALGRHGHSVGMTLHDGIMIVDVVFQGRTHDVPALADSLREEVEQRGRLLSAKERELLENHLVGEVAGALQELIAGAEEQVAAMNRDLAARPTSTGMTLRLRWVPAKESPPGLEAVRTRLLRQSSDAWRPADRAQVGEFLQARIAQEREEHPGDSWADQLTRALDYRTWHAFTIQRRQDGQWKPATGPASGGERVLAASVPLFAAASSHYSSGSPHAPRLIALDEAFAGVDDDSRAKCLGLLAAFDLDVVMTSEREWACYPTVPGVGIAQLSRREGIDAVLVTPWRWDGSTRTREQRPLPYVPAQAAAAVPAQPSLADAE
ncbi:TIGR02680 family protein [Streptomyces litchfieldiae]|uniref:TIGR02680 family protein n=1 Tax=Streptomyces litchfieldiae TaxID=3075543 RepID=A0ABU2MMH8_9ACTN|nr:TIGR02680 family protein [Streptomyces sp. DSM 44938]MDT0341859.1 TIGR02680 family protein [Streptomyces sp. DSM 44938]